MHAGAGNAEQADAVEFAGDLKAMNSYARGELLDVAGVLDRMGARQASLIRGALR